MKRQLKQNKFILFSAFLALFIAFFPYLRIGIQGGSDFPYHMARIETLAHDLNFSQFPVKIHAELANDYGYGTGFFYCNFWLYIPALLIKFGCSLTVAYKIFALMILAGILGCMYLIVWKLTRDTYLSLAGGILYLLSQPVMRSFYSEFTLGMSLGMVFLPLAIGGMFEFVTTEKKPWLLGAGFTGLIFSHVLSTALGLMVCFVILVCNWKSFYKKTRKIAELFIAVISVMGLTMSMWAPMLEQFLSQSFKVSQPWTHIVENQVSIKYFLGNEALGYGTAIILLILTVLVFSWSEKKRGKYLLLGFGFLLWILPSVSFFWNLCGDLLDFMQFTRRLYVPALVLLICGLMLGLTSVLKDRKEKVLLVLLSLGISGIFAYQYMETRFEETEYLADRVLYEEIMGLGAGEEWLPVETTREMLINPTQAIASDGSMVEGEKKSGTFTFVGNYEKEFYDVPFIWYKGYVAETQNGQKLNVVKNEDTGLVRVYTPEPKLERADDLDIKVWYAGTLIQELSYAITIISWLFLLAWVFYYKKTGRSFLMIKKTKVK